MADWVFLTAAPPAAQVVTAASADAAARRAGAYVARNMEGDGSAAFSVWIINGVAQQFDVVVETRVNRTVTVTPTPPPPPP
jgi:hypothetical protein